jgi:hypothetical protein
MDGKCGTASPQGISPEKEKSFWGQAPCEMANAQALRKKAGTGCTRECEGGGVGSKQDVYYRNPESPSLRAKLYTAIK